MSRSGRAARAWPARMWRVWRHCGGSICAGLVRTDGQDCNRRRLDPAPRWFGKDLSPRRYVPAFLAHDWEFDQHHVGASQKG